MHNVILIQSVKNLIKKLRREKEWGAKKFAAKQWCGSGL